MLQKAKVNMATIRQSFPGGTNKKNTGDHWRSTILAEHNIGEQEVMLYDRIALERHDYTATKAERIHNTEHRGSLFEC